MPDETIGTSLARLAAVAIIALVAAVTWLAGVGRR